MKNKIGFLLICMSFNSCINWLGSSLSQCKVEGNINDKIIIYPIKHENGKRVKHYSVQNILIKEKLDSTNWESLWIERDLKPIKGVILYGQTNENKRQSILAAKKLKEKSTYIVNFNIRTFSSGNIICGCEFNIDEHGNAVQIR